MITQEIKADSLKDYYLKLCDLQQGRHGIDYIDVHSELRRLIREGCTSYAELGIMQGATLAAVLLVNPSSVQAVDIDLGWYNKAREHFETYTNENDISLSVVEADSTQVDIEPVDVLYIDSLHVPRHLLAELNKHHSNVKKYIVLHDTSHKPKLAVAAKQWCATNPEWEVQKQRTISVGYMTLRRISQ